MENRKLEPTHHILFVSLQERHVQVSSELNSCPLYCRSEILYLFPNVMRLFSLKAPAQPHVIGWGCTRYQAVFGAGIRNPNESYPCFKALEPKEDSISIWESPDGNNSINHEGGVTWGEQGQACLGRCLQMWSQAPWPSVSLCPCLVLGKLQQNLITSSQSPNVWSV